MGNIAEAPDWFGMVNIVAQSAVAVYEENDAAGKGKSFRAVVEHTTYSYSNLIQSSLNAS